MEEGILAEVDCSKTYTEGQAFQVVYDKHHLYKIIFKNQGVLPEGLSGKYTSVAKTLTAIGTFITAREDHFKHVARKKSAKRTVKKTIEKQ